MISLKKLYIVALTSTVLSTKIESKGSKESSDSQMHLSLCCSPGKAQLDQKCINDNVTSFIVPGIRTSMNNTELEKKTFEEFKLLIKDPCDVAWMMSLVLKDFEVFQNGSIYARDFEGELALKDMEHHCLFRRPESRIYLAKVCHSWLVKVYWQIVCMISVTFLLLFIFIAYSIVPELKNLHGMVFRSYIATYIGTNVSMLGQLFTADSKANAHLFVFFIYSLHYFSACCALWLNVMSFNIWRTFRGLRSLEKNTKKRDRKKFIQYATYAWVTPAILYISIAVIMSNVAYFRNFPLNQNLIIWICATLLTTIAIINACLYTSTTLRIIQHQKDTADLTNGVNKHHEAEKQWFNLHVKLFMVTGVHTIMWVIWELWPIYVNTIIMTILEIVQSILIFVIFVWKDNVKRALRQQCNDTLSRIQSSFGPSHAITPKSAAVSP